MGREYVYQAAATDDDHDALTFAILSGPADMSMDATSGVVTWHPQTSNLGNQTVLLQVDDGHGGTREQRYIVSASVAPPNRPPLFTSKPRTDGRVNGPYVYRASGLDPPDDVFMVKVAWWLGR